MTKEQLKNYRVLQKEIQDIESEIKESALQDTVKGSECRFPYIQHAINICGSSDSDIGRKKALLCEYKKQSAEIEDFINNIGDMVTHRIFKLMYIKGDRRPSWSRVAYLVGGGNTPDSVRKIHSRFLKKSLKN